MGAVETLPEAGLKDGTEKKKMEDSVCYPLVSGLGCCVNTDPLTVALMIFAQQERRRTVVPPQRGQATGLFPPTGTMRSKRCEQSLQ